MPKDLDEIVFLDLDRAPEGAMARMPADLDALTRARAASFYVIAQTMLVNSRDPTRFVGDMLRDEPEAAGAAVRSFDAPRTRSIHAHLQQYAVAPTAPRLLPTRTPGTLHSIGTIAGAGAAWVRSAELGGRPR